MRTKKTFISTLAETIPYIILAIIGFVKVRVIIDYMGSDLNGYYQFINQIIGYLFLIEAGFGRAVIYYLYKPFADKNFDSVSAVFNGSRKIFRIIGLIILGIILLSLFIIPWLFNIESTYLWPVMISFMIISMSYLIAYFGKSNAYYALFCADQKKYVYSLIFNTLKIIDDLLIIAVAIYFKSIIGMALVILVIKIIEELMIRYFGRKHFPFINKVAKPDTKAFAMTKDLIWHQVGFLVSNNVDVVVLMYFMNPLVVSIYTTYNLIARFLNELTTRINNVVSYSFGNMFAHNEKIRTRQVNDEYFIVSTFLAITIALTFTVAIRPFVGIWIGNINYDVSYLAVMMFGLNLFFWTIYSPLVAVINAKGLYKESKHIVIISAIVNVILSIYLVYLVKDTSISNAITAILFATVVANIINIVLRIRVVQKYVFPEESKISIYLEYFVYTVMFLFMMITFSNIETWLFKFNHNIFAITGLILVVGIATSIITFIIMYLTKHNTKLLIERAILIIKGKQRP